VRGCIFHVIHLTLKLLLLLFFIFIIVIIIKIIQVNLGQICLSDPGNMDQNIIYKQSINNL
jgi:hypothetical protein